MLKGKTALITGSNRGIGKALVRQFAHNGADIIAHARRETSDFMQMCIEISDAYSVKVMPLFFDMTDSAAMKSALRGLMSSKVPVNVLVNNAGVAHGGLFQMTSITVIREIFDINLFSQMELTQYLLRYMCKWSNACIINRRIQLASATPSRLNEKARWYSTLASPSNQRLRGVWAMHTLPGKNGTTSARQ